MARKQASLRKSRRSRSRRKSRKASRRKQKSKSRKKRRSRRTKLVLVYMHGGGKAMCKSCQEGDDGLPYPTVPNTRLGSAPTYSKVKHSNPLDDQGKAKRWQEHKEARLTFRQGRTREEMQKGIDKTMKSKQKTPKTIKVKKSKLKKK